MNIQIDQLVVISGDFLFVFHVSVIVHTILSSVHKVFCLG